MNRSDRPEPPSPREIEPAAVRGALERLLSSQTFSKSTQLCRFLEYTVGRRLEDPAPRIKEYTIATEVFGRPASYNPAGDGTVRTEALRLRKKLARYYESEGRGDPVRIEYAKGSYVPSFVATEVPVAIETPEAPETPVVRARRLGRSRWLAIGILALAPIGIALRFLPLDEPASAPPRVGVLPFQDVSQEQVNDDFALAMSESILDRLVDANEVEVVSRASLQSFRNSTLSRSQIGAAIGADYLIGGTIAKSDDSFHVDALLIRAHDDRELWAGSFDFSWPEIFDAQEQLAQQIAEQLSVSETPQARRPTRNLEAYEAYLKGRFSAVRYSHTRRDALFEEAEERLLRAVTFDPNLADAWAELGILHLMRLLPPRPGLNRDEILGQARIYLDRALAVDPNHPNALTWLGLVEAHSGRRLEGIELCREAIRRDPGNPDAHEALGEIYSWLGFHESAIVEYERTVDLDPLYLSVFALVSRELAFVERWEEALTYGRRLQQLAPDTPYSEIFIGDVYYRMNELDRAEAVWREGDARFPSEEGGVYDIALALLAAERGDLEGARRVLENERDRLDREMTHTIEIAALLDDPEFVVDRIAGNPQRNYRLLVSNRNLARLANDSQFADLVRSKYAEWRWNLEALGDTLPVPPPSLPDPEEFLAQAASR